MSNIGSWALAAASNNASPPNGWPEGQAPSTVNNCAREMMSAIRAQWDDAVWFNFYPTTSPSTYISLKSQNKIRISNQSAATTYTATDIYPIGTRLKVNNLNTNKYGSVASLSSSSTAVILTMTMDSGTLTSTITTVYRSIITPGSTPIPSSLALSAATQAEMEAATSTTKGVTPGRAQFHPSAAKFYLMASSSGGGTVVVSYNITSVTDNGTGDLTVTIATDFSTNNYTILANALKDSSTSQYVYVSIKDGATTVGAFQALCAYNSTTTINPNAWFFAGFGDQA